MKAAAFTRTSTRRSAKNESKRFESCVFESLRLGASLCCILAIPKALSGVIAVFYWGYSSWNGGVEFDSFEAMARTLAANQALEGIKGILGVLVMGWLAFRL